MKKRCSSPFFALVAGLWCLGSSTAVAQTAAPAGGPADYATFTKGLTPQAGLFTIWRKDGKVYLELAKAQLDTDFIQTIVPSSGLGRFGITPGVPYLQFPSARIVHSKLFPRD
jgi:Domain of unknown function (DUF5118)